MADDKEGPVDPGPKVKDLLRAGTLGEHEHKVEDLLSVVAKRSFRRPAGNSERLWKKVDGDDPWNAPKPKKKPKPRGVYVAGRFVRIDKGNNAKKPGSHIPDWARDRAAQPRTPNATASAPARASSKGDAAADKLKEILALKKAEADALKANTNAAASRMKRQQEAVVEEQTERLPVPAPTKPRRSKSGRLRTQSGSRARAHTARPERAERKMAAGRERETRGAVTDVPLEMRRPPRIENAEKKSAKGAPRKRTYAAGRSAPAPTGPAVDLPLEMRRPPRVVPGEDPRPATTAAPRPVALSSNPVTDPSLALPPAAEAGPATTDAPPDPPAPPPPVKEKKPVERSLKGVNSGGGMDDMFGMASAAGPMRIGRRSRKQAVAEPDEPATDKGESSSD